VAADVGRSGATEYQHRLRTDKPMPDDWDLAWEDDRSVVEEEAEVARAIGMTGVRIETRLRPAGTRGEWLVSW
jgi:hypothetical protein